MSGARASLVIACLLLLTVGCSSQDTAALPAPSRPPTATNVDTVPASSEGGRIAFTSNHDGNLEIYTIKADGSELVNLTNHSARDLSPIWAPDGQHLAFVSDRDGRNNIYTMRADGTQVARLTDDGGTAPNWSPDGTHIVFQQSQGDVAHLVSISVVGGEQTRLLSSPAFGSIAWAPDGTRLAVSLDLHQTVIMQKNATDPITVTNFWFPSWLPDAAQLLGNTSDGFALIHSDGTSRTLLGITGSAPTISPDGTMLVFSRPGGPGGHKLYLANVNGTAVRQLTTAYGTDFEPAWSPTSTQVAFTRRTDLAAVGIRIISTNGTAEIGLAGGTTPIWQPQPPAPTSEGNP